MKHLSILLIILFFSSCSNTQTKKYKHISNANLSKVKWQEIEGFEDDNLNLALKIFQKNCKASYKNIYLKDVCKKALLNTNGKLFFTQNFTPYKLLNKKNNELGLITGYYEPIIDGSFEKNDIYKYPIYKTPNDLIVVQLSSIYPELKKYRLRGKIVNNKLIPYDSRKELHKNENLEPLIYLKSKIDRFFLEIQGSGKVRLPNKKIVHVAYANQNGRKYYPVGRKLIKDGLIKKEDMSLQAIKQWCKENPQKIDELFNLNKSSVFFHISEQSATGSLGVELTAKRNIAVDRNFIPLGFPVFLNTTNPLTNQKINSLVIAADTGGAIKGEIRADYFWGNGVEAELGAGKMAEDGKLTILIPNSAISKKSFRGTIPSNIKMKILTNR